MRNDGLKKAISTMAVGSDHPARSFLEPQVVQAMDSAQLTAESDTRFIELSKQVADSRGVVSDIDNVAETTFTLDGNTAYAYSLEASGYFVGGGVARNFFAQLRGVGDSGLADSSIWRRIYYSYDTAVVTTDNGTLQGSSSGIKIGTNDWVADGQWTLTGLIGTRRRAGFIRVGSQWTFTFERGDAGYYIRYDIQGHRFETNGVNFNSLRLVWDGGVMRDARFVLRRI